MSCRNVGFPKFGDRRERFQSVEDEWEWVAKSLVFVEEIVVPFHLVEVLRRFLERHILFAAGIEGIAHTRREACCGE